MLANRSCLPVILGLAISVMATACAAPGNSSRQIAAAPSGEGEWQRRLQLWHSTVIVDSGIGHGTGVIIDAGSVLTAHHVVEAAAPVIEFFGGERVFGELAWSDESLDLAVVTVPVPARYPTAPLYCGTLQAEQRLTAVGHPLTLRWVTVEGFARHLDSAPESRLVPLSFDLSLGNSGGPVFDDKGRVVGITSEILVTVKAGEFGGEPPPGIDTAMTGQGLMMPASSFCRELAFG